MKKITPLLLSLNCIILPAILSAKPVFAQNSSPEKGSKIERLDKMSKSHQEIRFAMWPEIFPYNLFKDENGHRIKNKKYNSKSELIQFRNRHQSSLLTAAFENDDKNFLRIWNSLSKRQQLFFATDFDPSSGKNRLHHIAMSPREIWSKDKKNDNPQILQVVCESLKTHTDVNISEYANAKDNEGDTPLNLALWTAQGNFNMARTLIESCGADPKLASSSGVTPLMLSAYWAIEDIFDYLISLGADDWAVTSNGRGVYYYFNTGRVKGVHSSQASSVKNWLDNNGHSFQKEALDECLGFTDQNALISEDSLLSPAYKKGKLSKAFPTFTIDASERTRIQKIMNKELQAQCLNHGYTTCSIVMSEKLNGPVKTISEEVSLNIGSATLYYGYQVFHAAVIGSASGNAQDCKLNL